MVKKESFVFKDFESGTCFAVDAKNLEKYRNEMLQSGCDGAALAVCHIFDEEYTPCIYSGAIQLSWTMETYRRVDGTVGRSWECGLIQDLDTRGIYDVLKVQEEQGVKEAVKSLYGKFEWEKEINKESSLDEKTADAAARVNKRDPKREKEHSKDDM